jgi:hypothetical protein
MRNIKTYKDFCNEEINFKKALVGATLGAGLALSNPAFSNVTSNRIENINKVISSQSSNIDGWGKAKWNMTPDEVKNCFPVAVDDSSRYDDNRISLIKIDNFKIGDEYYEVNFIFVDNKLESVRLQLSDIDATELNYDKIKSKILKNVPDAEIFNLLTEALGSYLKPDLLIFSKS